MIVLSTLFVIVLALVIAGLIYKYYNAAKATRWAEGHMSAFRAVTDIVIGVIAFILAAFLFGLIGGVHPGTWLAALIAAIVAVVIFDVIIWRKNDERSEARTLRRIPYLRVPAALTAIVLVLLLWWLVHPRSHVEAEEPPPTPCPGYVQDNTCYIPGTTSAAPTTTVIPPPTPPPCPGQVENGVCVIETPAPSPQPTEALQVQDLGAQEYGTVQTYPQTSSDSYIVARGDLNNNGSFCFVRIFLPNEPVDGLGQGTKEFYRITGGSPSDVQQYVSDHIVQECQLEPMG